jgi:hypothetical protein
VSLVASQYITLSVDGNYSITAYDIVNGIITDTSSVQYDDIFHFINTIYINGDLTSQLLLPSNNPCACTYKIKDNFVENIIIIIFSVPTCILAISMIFVLTCITIVNRKKCKKNKLSNSISKSSQLSLDFDKNHFETNGASSKPATAHRKNIKSSFSHDKKGGAVISASVGSTKYGLVQAQPVDRLSHELLSNVLRVNID